MTTLKKPVTRRTNGALTPDFGTDRAKRLTVTLIPGNGTTTPDLLSIRPERTQRAENIAIIDVYRYALRCRVGRELLERARERKAKKAIIRERRSIDRAKKRIGRPL